jgi:hypothetical protein
MTDEKHYAQWLLEGIIKLCPYCKKDIKPVLNESKPKYLKRVFCGGKSCRKALYQENSKKLKTNYYANHITIYD